MKLSRWTLALALALGVSGVACSDAPQQRTAQRAQPSMAERAGAPAADSNVDTNVVFVDVRTEREYRAGHVEGAIHIPHDRMAQRYEELERFEDKQIVVYCRTGRRSAMAERILEERGFEVINGGGLRQLAGQGVPTTANCC